MKNTTCNPETLKEEEDVEEEKEKEENVDVNSESETASDIADLFGKTCTISSSTAHLCHNGGLCLQRHAYWSQTITEISVHIPVRYIQKSLKTAESKQDLMMKDDCLSSYQLHFKVNCCEIQAQNGKIPEHDEQQHRLTLCLASSIVPSESTWYHSNIDNIEYLVIVFYKTTPITLFPGCEWWDRVFEEDEKIDTLTCTVGASTSQLPLHAQVRAEQEHARFQALSAQEQAAELAGIGSYKQVWCNGGLWCVHMCMWHGGGWGGVKDA